ncbi:DUF3558 domain-containing protein [Nocardia miyunensis]|uniref:DUF3558 domain-containing protein n=1 Tax=Nocardia miyunensis TaxID=282684 RepID=UPI000A05F56E
MRALAVVAGVCAVLAVAGCKSESGSATTSAAKLTEAQLWDPCTLSDSALQATGVDPSTKDTNPFGGHQTGWKGCDWRNDTYYLNVFTTVHTMDEVRTNNLLKNVHDVDVAGRNAVSETQGSSNDNCGVDFPTSKGVVQVVIRQQYGSPSAGDLCAIALRSANSLNSSIPK